MNRGRPQGQRVTQKLGVEFPGVPVYAATLDRHLNITMVQPTGAGASEGTTYPGPLG